MRTPKQDPRRQGGTYHSGYWRMDYTILSLGIDDGSPFRPVSVQWADGRVTHHCTPWDFKRDSVVSHE